MQWTFEQKEKMRRIKCSDTSSSSSSSSAGSDEKDSSTLTFSILETLMNHDNVSTVLTKLMPGYLHILKTVNNNSVRMRTNSALYVDAWRRRLQEIGRGKHGTVHMLRPSKHSENRTVGKFSIYPHTMTRGVDTPGDDLPIFVAEMIHSAMLSSLAQMQISPHFCRCFQFFTTHSSSSSSSSSSSENVETETLNFGYEMEHIPFSLEHIHKSVSRITIEDVDAIVIGVIHSVATYQHHFQLTHNDLKLENCRIALFDDDSIHWFAYHFGEQDDVVYMPAPRFVVKICDFGLSTSRRVQFGDRCLSNVTIAPEGVGMNRKRISDISTVYPGQYIRILNKSDQVVDARIISIDEDGTIAACIHPFYDEDDQEEDLMLLRLDDPQHQLYSIHPLYESYGIHCAFQRGYDVHFFISDLLRVLPSWGIQDPNNVPSLRALLRVHSFETSKTDMDAPACIRKTSRPKYHDVLSLSALELMQRTQMLAHLRNNNPDKKHQNPHHQNNNNNDGNVLHIYANW